MCSPDAPIWHRGTEFRRCCVHGWQLKHTSIFISKKCFAVNIFFFFIDIRKMKVWLRPFPLHKHRGTPTGLWGHWLSSPCHCLCVTQLFTHSPRPWTHWSPSTHENQTRPWHVRLCVAFTYPGFSKKTLVCSTPLWSQCTQQEWWRHSGNFSPTSLD